MVADKNTSSSLDKSRGKFANRGEAIAAELKRAAQFGIAAPAAVALDDRFRVEGLARLTDDRQNAIHAPSMRPSAVRSAAALRDNPFISKATSEQAAKCLVADLKRPHDGADGLQSDEMVRTYRMLAATDVDAKTLQEAERHILRALVGPDFAKRMDGASADQRSTRK